MRSLPCNGGNRSNLLRPSAGSEGLLTGEVRREVLHRRLHQPRPLSASRQAYYPGHCFYEMISYYLTSSPHICQFPFLGFLPYFMDIPTIAAKNPGAMLVFFPVYQMSTKKSVNPLRRRGLAAFHILGRLPDVYQFNFFTSKALLFRRFPPVSQSLNPMQGS